MDGELGLLTEAQRALADAYLAHGRGAEARAVAEDLVASHPGDASHVSRLRRALQLAGEPDVERALAERLSAGRMGAGGPPLDLSDDESMTVLREPPPAAPATAESAAPEAPRPAGAKKSGRTSQSGDPFRLGPIAIDLGDILGDDPERAGDGQDAPEVDLSDALAGLKGAPPKPPPPPPATLDGVFAEFRDEVARHTQSDAAEQHFKVGLTYEETGMVAEAIKELEIAVRAPRLRFEAASHLARLCLKGGRPIEAVDWFERAAEAPAPTVDAGRMLLYELGDTLEAGGETARALAVFLELQSDAPEFRDVARRVERLARVQAGG